MATPTTSTPTRRPDRADRERHRSPRLVPAAAVLLPARIFLAAGWLRAAVEKTIDPTWWSGEALDGFLAEQRAHMVEWFVPIADGLIAPAAAPIAWSVVALQVVVGVTLLTGRDLRTALWLGIAMNVVFVLCGAVNPSAFYLVLALTLLLAMAEPVTWRTTLLRTGAWIGAALAFVPFIRTLHPAEAIDDPALMLSFTCTLAAIGTVAIGEWHRMPALRAWFGRRPAGAPS